MTDTKHKPYPERMQWRTPVETSNVCGADTKHKPDCASRIDDMGLCPCTCDADTTPTPCHLCKGKMVVPADDGHGLQRCVCGNGEEPHIASTPLSSTTILIMHEVYKAVERLGVGPDLLCILGSFGDTLSDAEVLELLTEWNKGHRPIKLPIVEVGESCTEN